MTDLELYLATIALAFALNGWTLALWRRDIQRLRANSHRRDPRTGRLLPLGK